MTRFFPGAIPAGVPSSERRVWLALESLPDSWHAFYSVAWQAPRGGRQGDGESDFILVHPSHGIVVLEVKGGRIEIDGGQWFSTDRNEVRHGIKDPFRQAVDSKHALLKYLHDAFGQARIPKINHAVIMPDVTLEQSIGLQSRAIVIDSDDLRDLGASLQRTLSHWGSWSTESLSTTEVGGLVRLLAPTLAIGLGLRAQLAEAEQSLIELTARQVQVLRMLRSIRRSVIRGGAGTGKTLLAIEQAKRVAMEGGRPLVVCFNAPLAASLLAGVDKSITVSTFHALCGKLGAGRVPQGVDDKWFYEHAAEVLADGAESLDVAKKFDALIVDEAQDLCDDWLAALQLLLKDPKDGPCALFLDNHQQIYQSTLTIPASWAVVELDQNCRNTLPIARLVARCFADAAPEQGASGPQPKFVEIADASYVSTIQDVVAGLLVDDQLQPYQVVVLANAKHHVDNLRTKLAGPAAFVSLGGRGVVVETIHRFKGLEAETVVLCLSGRPGEFTSEDTDRALAYVATSRARSALIVVGSQSWLQLLRPRATN